MIYFWIGLALLIFILLISSKATREFCGVVLDLVADIVTAIVD